MRCLLLSAATTCISLLAGVFSIAASAQNISVKGTVYDTDNKPVVGATVEILDLNQKKLGGGKITDLDGNFVLKDVPSDVILRIACMGLETQEVRLNGRTVISVILKQDEKFLEGVVVTALGIKRSEKALSYNVQEVKNSALTTVKEANFVNSLNGKVAGVNITRSSAGIGGATRVIMRGTKSITGSNGVLYVVDGMPIGNQNLSGSGEEYGRPGSGEGISDFNTEDIESISVLTGPSAAALYGASAANGVILINTRKGSKGAMKINVSSNTEFLTASTMPEFQNTYGTQPNSYRSWGEKLATPSKFDPRVFFRTGYNTINSVSMSGGNERSQTFISVATTHSNGIIPNTHYERYNFTGRNTSVFFNDRLHLDISGSYVIQADRNMMSGGRYFNPLRSLYLFPRGDDFEDVMAWERWDPTRRIYTQYWPYGSQGEDFENPYWIVNREIFSSKKHRYMFNARAQFDITEWLNIAGRVRIDNTDNSSATYFHATTSPLFTGDKADKPMGSFGKSERRYKQTYADLMLNINRTWNKLSLTANLGTSFEDHYTTSMGIGGRLKLIPNFFSTANVDPDSAGGGSEGYARNRNVAIFVSGELGWKKMLYLTLTGRVDWASQLVSNGKTPPIPYPSVGLSAIVSEMLQMPSWWPYLKLRGSFTEVGSPISMTGVTPGTITYDMDASGVKPITTYPYPNFRPERTRSWEFGISSRFFGGSVTFDATIYQSNTYNQTFLQNVAASTGYTGFYIQSGNIRNRGIEASLGYNNKWGEFGFGSTLTFTRNVNRVMSLVDNYTNPITGETFSITTLKSPKYMRVGDSMSDIFVRGILVKGKDGRFIEEGDGYKIDRTQLIKVGKSSPNCIIGWNNSFSLYGFNLDFLITARFGGLVSSATQAYLDGFGVSKVTADARDAGGVVIDGEKYDAKRYYTTIGINRLGAYYLYDATQVKLQELSLGYSFPKKWIGKYISNLNLSLIGRNLLTIYRAAPYDTELVGGTGTYSDGGDNFMPPAQRSLGFSVKVGF